MNAETRGYGNGKDGGNGGNYGNAEAKVTDMNIAPAPQSDAELTGAIIGAFYEVYNDLGHGFLESVYVNALSLVLKNAGLRVEREKPIQVWFHGTLVGEFRADMVIEGKVIVEIKAARALEAAHEAQLLNYLRATEIEVGLLFNFGLRPEFKRLAFSNDRKRIRAHKTP
jgi:GxxExxY protein